jgi:hypothetical protein
MHFKELALEFIDHCPIFTGVLVPSNWYFKISRVSHAVRSNRAKIRDNEMSLKDLTNISLRFSFKNFNAEFYSPLDNTDLLRFYSYQS